MKYIHLTMICCLLSVLTTAGIKAQTDTITAGISSTTDTLNRTVADSINASNDTINRIVADSINASNDTINRTVADSIKTPTDTISRKKTARVKSPADTAKRVIPELRYEIALYGGGGMSALNYSLDNSGSKTDGTGGISGLIGIAYTWNISNYFGIVTGMELSSYGAKTTYDAISGEKRYSDGFVHHSTFNYLMNNYIEEQSVTILSIPLMLQYSVPLEDDKKFYMLGGFRLGLPINSEAAIFPGTVSTWGYFSYENRTYTDLPKLGYVSSNKPGSITNDIDMDISLIASFETGVRFVLTPNILLYIGAYIDYGLNNIRSTSAKDLLNYQETEPSVFKYVSALNTSHVNQVKIFGAGLKVKIAFGW
jgi:hypothetical protein